MQILARRPTWRAIAWLSLLVLAWGAAPGPQPPPAPGPAVPALSSPDASLPGTLAAQGSDLEPAGLLSGPAPWPLSSARLGLPADPVRGGPLAGPARPTRAPPLG
jgi:hypothetical protein